MKDVEGGQPVFTSGVTYSDNALCVCGDIKSMSHHIIGLNDCPVNKFEAGLATLHITASDSTREWLRRVHCILR